jgi:NADPH-dependent glutamate synthase beta subunit-like oxidoreductase
MVEVKLYVEGGGDSAQLHSRCREGFCKFLERAGFKGHMPRIVACGGRQTAYDCFKTACENNVTALLLIDSEDFVTTSSPWEHLANSVLVQRESYKSDLGISYTFDEFSEASGFFRKDFEERIG